MITEIFLEKYKTQIYTNKESWRVDTTEQLKDEISNEGGNIIRVRGITFEDTDFKRWNKRQAALEDYERTDWIKEPMYTAAYSCELRKTGATTLRDKIASVLDKHTDQVRSRDDNYRYVENVIYLDHGIKDSIIEMIAELLEE